MTPTEFIIWLRGFSQAANNFTLTPKQWDDVKEKLDKVVLDENLRASRYNLDSTNWNVDATAKILLTDNTTP